MSINFSTQLNYDSTQLDILIPRPIPLFFLGSRMMVENVGALGTFTA